MLNKRFWVINPLFPSPLGDHRILNPSTTSPMEPLTYLPSFSFVSCKTVQCFLNLHSFRDYPFIAKSPGAPIEGGAINKGKTSKKKTDGQKN